MIQVSYRYPGDFKSLIFISVLMLFYNKCYLFKIPWRPVQPQSIYVDILQKLTEDTHESQLSSKGSISRLQFRNNEDNLVLTLGKKEFSHHEHRNVFAENSGQWVK